MTNPATGSPNAWICAVALSTLAAGSVNVSELLEAAQTTWGLDLQILTLREVLLHARGVNARVVLARLTAFGIENAESIPVRDVLDAKHLALIADALSANDRHSPTPQWPFVHDES
jgi:hypothetical protein